MSLTTGADAGAAFTGGAGNDVYTAATAAMVQTFDSINGGAGTDTLRVTDIVKAFEGQTGLALTATSIEGLEISTTGGFGTAQVNASGAVGANAGQKEVQTFTLVTGTAGGGTIDLTGFTITANGASYATTSLTDTTQAAVLDSIDAALVNIFGDAVTIAHTNPTGTTNGFVSVTAKKEGVDIADIAIESLTTGTGGTLNLSITKATTAPVTVISDLGAKSQVQTLMFASSAATPADDNYKVAFNGLVIDAYTGDTPADAASAVAAVINAAHGSTIATATGVLVTITGPVGVPLPPVGMILDGTTNAPTVTNTIVTPASTATASASGAVSKVVFDATDFTDAITFGASGDVVLKAAATANVTVSNTKGMVEVDGGKVVSVTTTGEGAIVVTGKALTSVSAKGGANFEVDNLANTTAATSATGETLTAVSINAINGPDSELKGAALTDIGITNQTKALAVTVTNGKSTALNLNLDNVGYTSTGGDVTVSVAAGAKAETINVATASKSQVTLTGAAAETLNLSGAGDLKVNSILAVKTVNGSSATGKLNLGDLNAATTSVKTGFGNDSFAVAATTKATIATGAGNDTVTLKSTLAAGTTVDLGAGNDSLLLGTSGVVAASTLSGTTVIDGGAGVDTLSAGLINAGNASQFKNFEILNLDAAGNFDVALFGAGLQGLSIDTAPSGSRTYSNVKTDQSLSVANIAANTTTTTLTFSAVTGTADAYAISFDGEAASAATKAAPSTAAAGTIGVAGIETISIASGGTGFVQNSITLAATDARTVTVSGDKDITVALTGTVGVTGGTAANGNGLALVDGSAATGDLTLNLTGGTINAAHTSIGLTVKGGSGDDAITVENKATIEAGAGDDTVVIAVGGQGSTITLGAGKDVVNVSAAILNDGNGAVTLDNITVIKDFSVGVDSLTLHDQGTEVFHATAVDVSAATTLAAALALGRLDGSTNGQIKHFQFGGDTFLVQDNSTSTSALVVDDIVVKFEGLVDLSTLTVSDFTFV